MRHEAELDVTELKMLRFSLEVIDGIRNLKLRGAAQVGNWKTKIGQTEMV